MREVRLKIREGASNMIDMIENCDGQTHAAMMEAASHTTWMWAHSTMNPIKEAANGAWKRTVVKIISSSPWTL
jgi:hypothetical protein